jgi:NAD+ kinase
MSREFHKIAVIGRHDDARVAEPMAALVEHLTKNGVEVFAAEEMSLDIPVSRVGEASLADNAELIISVGGDGTMLRAGRLASGKNVPLLGINRGRLGFLADVTPDAMLASIDHVLDGNYTSESRLQLHATLTASDGTESVGIALNDIVLQRSETGRMVDFETRVGEHYVNTHSGDGLIVATPTGSTAYALSCGGPILEPQLDAIAIVPVCPHKLTDRPIVIPSDEAVEVHLLERDDTQAAITVDGRAIGHIRPGDRLRICAAKNRVTLIHPPGYDFYGTLRSKLFWGRDSRKRDPQDENP